MGAPDFGRTHISASHRFPDFGPGEQSFDHRRCRTAPLPSHVAYRSGLIISPKYRKTRKNIHIRKLECLIESTT
jgi:hypothetical protein